MVYIGHFSFDEVGENQNNRHGYFTCVVESTDVDRSLEDFKSLIERIKDMNATFAGITAVYIEDIFEMRKVPHRPVMIRLQSSDGEFPESVSRSLPFTGDEGITAYGWAADVQKISAAEGNQVLEMEPFLRFQ
jgi:hypothetical protein